MTSIHRFLSTSKVGSVLFFYYTHEAEDMEIEVEETIQEIEKDNNDNIVTMENQDLVENEDHDDDALKSKTRMVTRTISEQRIKCHARMDTIPNGAGDISCVYLIRIKGGNVTTLEGSLMYTYVDVGCTSGDLLTSLETILKHVFIPLVEAIEESDSEDDDVEIDAVKN